MSDRLPTRLEVAALCRSVEADGGFAAVLNRGDPDRGTLTILIAERGAPVAALKRQMSEEFTYRWSRMGGESRDWARLAQDEARIDPDSWLIELDVADAERFVDEMIATG